MNKDHICFKCKEVSIREIETSGASSFYETACDGFSSHTQQVNGNVKKCDKFDFKEFKGSLKERGKELEKIRSFHV